MKNSFQALLSQCPLIERCIGYTFASKKLLAQAFVHRSYFNEQREGVEEHNERLEFLGDAVFGVLVSDYLYQNLPSHAEGQLSHTRSYVVEAASCARYVQKLGLAEFVLLGKGERMNEGRGRETILADLFEALIGAIYLDGGLAAAKTFFFTNFQEEMTLALKEPLRNWKAELQDYSQKKFQKPPIYKVLQEMGPDHGKVFCVGIYLNDIESGKGTGSSKKQAEQAAAAEAALRLNII